MFNAKPVNEVRFQKSLIDVKQNHNAEYRTAKYALHSDHARTLRQEEGCCLIGVSLF